MAENANTWISGKEAAAIIGCTPDQVKKLATRGVLTYKQIPGISRPSYSKESAEELANRFVNVGSAEAVSRS